MRIAQPFERRGNFLLADFQCVGDHSRGLFEAEASIAVSAAHALQHVNILVNFRHNFSFLICRREADLLRGNQFHRGLRLAVFINDHTDAHKDAPLLFAPDGLEDDECVFGHESWRLMAMHQRPKSNLPALTDLQGWVEALFG